MVAQINDQGLTAIPSPQNLSQSVLLLGVATDGPINTPIAINSITAAQNLFGTTTASTSVTGNAMLAKSLTARVWELLNAGCTDVRMCRVGGTYAALTLSDSVTANALILTGNYPGQKYNGLQAAAVVSATAGVINVTTLDGLVHPFPFTPGVSVYGDLINLINVSNININASQGTSGNPLALMTTTTTALTAFAGGTDGTNPTDVQYSNALTAAYQQLETYAVSVVVPCGAYLQPSLALDNTGNVSSNSVPNAFGGDTVFYGQNLAQFCARVSVNTSSCYGVISMAPLLVPTYTNVINRGKQLVGTYDAYGNTLTVPTSYQFQYAAGYSTAATSNQVKQLPLTGANNALVDTGYLLQICVGPDAVVNSAPIGNYVADTAPSYAGLSVSLAPQSATTNKTVPNILALSYSFGASVLNSLVGLRFVTYNVISGTVRVVADQTYSLLGRDFTKLSTLRTTYAAMENVRSATQGFIGMASTPANLNSMGTAINSALTGMKSSGALLDYSYAINASTNNQIAGNLQITLTLIPALQIRKIIVTISLQPGGALSVASTS